MEWVVTVGESNSRRRSRHLTRLLKVLKKEIFEVVAPGVSA